MHGFTFIALNYDFSAYSNLFSNNFRVFRQYLSPILLYPSFDLIWDSTNFLQENRKSLWLHWARLRNWFWYHNDVRKRVQELLTDFVDKCPDHLWISQENLSMKGTFILFLDSLLQRFSSNIFSCPEMYAVATHIFCFHKAFIVNDCACEWFSSRRSTCCKFSRYKIAASKLKKEIIAFICRRSAQDNKCSIKAIQENLLF